jgi:hypothetical protein
VLVSRTWVTELADPGTNPAQQPVTVRVAPCHPDTGALLDPGGVAGGNATKVDAGGSADLGDAQRRATPAVTDPYRPSARLARHVRARDRRCRFPGCTVAAVFCDLDHVRPWPAGPTTAANLVCLCRRHHRVKQRPGWHAVLAPDATLTWTDPTGRVPTTHPADALTSTLLTDSVPTDRDLTGAANPPPTQTSPSRSRTDLPDGPHSDLEFTLEHPAAAVPARVRHTDWWDDRGHRHRHRLELTPSATAVLVETHGTWPHRRARGSRRRRDHDPPPF